MSGGFSRIGMLFAGIALCSALALPVGAADHGPDGAVFHRGGHRPGPGNFTHGVNAFAFDAGGRHAWLHRSRFHGIGNGFDHQGWVGQGHVRHLRMLSSNRLPPQRGSGISVVERGEIRDSFAGSYSGSIDVYHANGGTYVTGYSDGGYDGPSVLLLRPRAKIIDVAKAGSACSYEGGVCVIRP